MFSHFKLLNLCHPVKVDEASKYLVKEQNNDILMLLLCLLMRNRHCLTPHRDFPL